MTTTSGVNGEQQQVPDASEIPKILELCQTLGERLNFDAFWAEWREYLTEIGYLAQNTQGKVGINPFKANWGTFKIPDTRRLDSPLRWLLAFGDVAVHLSDPSDIETKTAGNRLRDHLRLSGHPPQVDLSPFARLYRHFDQQNS
jgi:CRISPR-associated protein Csc3